MHHLSWWQQMSPEVDIFSWHPFLCTNWCPVLHKCNPFSFHVPFPWLLLLLFIYQKEAVSYNYAALLLEIPKQLPFSFRLHSESGWKSHPSTAPPVALSNLHLLFCIILRDEISSQVGSAWPHRLKTNSFPCGDNKGEWLKSLGSGVGFVLQYYYLCGPGHLT